MKKENKILISEKQLKVIFEAVQTYDEFDYYDAFFTLLKDWVKNNYGEEELKKPLSLLLRKYSKKFKKYIEGIDVEDDADDDDYEERFNRWNMNRVIDKAVERGLYTFPSMRNEEKFLDRYGKALKMVVENLELPSYVKMRFEEKKPHEVAVHVFVVLEDWLKDPETRNFNSSTIEKQLKNYLTNFIGVEFGNPAHGKTHMDVYVDRNANFEDWKKKEYMKKIRPQIKLLEGGNRIKSITIEQQNTGLNLKVTFNHSLNYGGWTQKREIVDRIRNLLREMGYGPAIKVTS